MDYLIIGLGKTGLSCLRYCLKQGLTVAITDSRENPPGLDTFQRIASHVPHYFGDISEELVAKADALIVSPGVSLKTPVIAKAIKSGKAFLGDVELFAKAVGAKKIIGITGSNAKSTVTSLLGKIAVASGLRAQVVGNIGTPVLDKINDDVELYVMELSSFQLETTQHLPLVAATILNVTEDHMDRYDLMDDYIAAKQRIYANAQMIISNRSDVNTTNQQKKSLTFGQDAPKNKNEYGLVIKQGKTYLACGDELLLPADEINLHAKHDLQNALVAIALSDAIGLPRKVALNEVKQFKGLPHRCQLVSVIDDVRWYNDSKGTNVGACVAAIDGLADKKNIILIAGGVGKGADFLPLKAAVESHVKSLILIGEAAHDIEACCRGSVPIKQALSLDKAVEYAKSIAKPHDNVLLSPACASFDMFDNFEHRGDVFVNLVKNHE